MMEQRRRIAPNEKNNNLDNSSDNVTEQNKGLVSLLESLIRLDSALFKASGPDSVVT